MTDNGLRRRVGMGWMIALSAGVAGCSSMLDVDLPSQLTDEALEDPDAAETLVNSVIAMFECAYSSLALQAMGHEDIWERIAGQAAPSQYATTPSAGSCDTIEEGAAWYQNVQTSRAMAEQTYNRLSNQWSTAQVPNRDQYRAILAIYVAADMSVLGEYFCEVAVNGGALMTPDETLSQGEQWIQRALDHIGTTGDFAMPHGIASSAEVTAYALRARLRWAKGDFTNALADAARVPEGFTAWVTRDVGPQRRNKVAVAGFGLPFGAMLDVNTWWNGTNPNPVTLEPWPIPIPFTGYRDLGILPDGRAVRDDGIPIRTTVDATATADSRVTHVFKATSAGQPGHAQTKYTLDDEDFPLISWREIWLIRAQIEGGQTAIDLVNDVRDHHSLPTVTYADPAQAQQIRYMVLEERRRELWLEGGRWWSTKIQNVDLLWFPRDEGAFPTLSYALEGGVRMVMPDLEFDANPNLTRADRATLCDPAERPIDF